MDLNLKYSPKLKVYNLENGKISTFKMKIKDYQSNPFEKGSILKIISKENKQKVMKNGDQWLPIIDEYETWINEFEILLCENKAYRLLKSR